jgi:hypothetical protein
MLPVGNHQVLATDLEETPRPRSQASASDSVSIDSSISSKSTNLKAELEYTWPSVHFVADANAINENERKLIRSIGEQTRFLPSELQEYLKSDWASEMILDGSRIEWDARSNIKIAELWENVKEIQEAARRCTAESHHEESWSDNVILPLLNLSKRRAGLQDRVMLATM